MARLSLAKPKPGSSSPEVNHGPTGGVLSVRRCLRLLEIFSEEAGLLSLADLARSLAVNKAIALRLIDELRAAGFVYRDEATGAYALTYKLSNLGLRKLAQTRLFDQTSDVVRQLANDTKELVRLGVVETKSNRRCLTWVLSFVGERRTLHIDPTYSSKVQLNAHAAGKAWLSTLSPKIAWEALKLAGIERHTPFSKTKRKDIEADLKEAGLKGYAVNYEEAEIGVGAIAAPIIIKLASGERTCVGVISVAAPTHRMSKKDLNEQAPKLLNAAAKLSAIWPIGRRIITNPGPAV